MSKFIVWIVLFWISILSANAVELYDSQSGKYLGQLGGSQYDTNSTNNTYGRYGSRYSPDSINNPYGQYGSRYSNKSTNNPYETHYRPIIDYRLIGR